MFDCDFLKTHFDINSNASLHCKKIYITYSNTFLFKVSF